MRFDPGARSGNSALLPNGRHVLISGASIAGPALAYWLHRYGFRVTVVEQSASVRKGGYPVDLRGSAMDVAQRMGILPDLRRAHIRSARATFVDGEGQEVATVTPEWITGSVKGRDVELPRGVLASLLHSITCADVEYRFNDSAVEIADRKDVVEVTFRSGGREAFDLVIGADGIHSTVRELAFSPEGRYAHPVGFCFAGFSTPNTQGLSREAVCYNVPGRMAALYAAGNHPESVFTLLAFAHPYLLGEAGRNPAFQRTLTGNAFAGAGWKLPGLLESMRDSNDFYFDVVQQIRMPNWTRGRVGLVGDAAYAPSFLTGQGSSLALVGAYVLAGELALHEDHEQAFAEYQRKLRPFVEVNQATIEQGRSGMIPITSGQLLKRNCAMREVARTTERLSDRERPAHSAIDLTEYESLAPLSAFA